MEAHSYLCLWNVAQPISTGHEGAFCLLVFDYGKWAWPAVQATLSLAPRHSCQQHGPQGSQGARASCGPWSAGHLGVGTPLPCLLLGECHPIHTLPEPALPDNQTFSSLQQCLFTQLLPYILHAPPPQKKDTKQLYEILKKEKNYCVHAVTRLAVILTVPAYDTRACEGHLVGAKAMDLGPRGLGSSPARPLTCRVCSFLFGGHNNH